MFEAKPRTIIINFSPPFGGSKNKKKPRAFSRRRFIKAIIVSGDGDFHCLIEYLVAKGKLLLILAPNKNYSRLLKPFSKFIVRIDRLRGSLELKKTGIGGRSKP